MLHSSGYLPFKLLRNEDLFEQLEVSDVSQWGVMDVAWMLKDRAEDMKKELIRTAEKDIKSYGTKDRLTRAM